MRKTILALAALAAIGIVMPYAAPANAESKVIVHRHHHHILPLPVHHHDRGKTVIIKHHND